jgi:hypothetical protein
VIRETKVLQRALVPPTLLLDSDARGNRDRAMFQRMGMRECIGGNVTEALSVPDFVKVTLVVEADGERNSTIKCSNGRVDVLVKGLGRSVQLGTRIGLDRKRGGRARGTRDAGWSR